MKRNLIVIGIQEENLLFLQRQLEAVFRDQVQINTITLKDLHVQSIAPNDIVLLTGKSIVEIVKPFLPESSMWIVADRTVNIANMKELFYVKSNSTILVVNDNDYDTVQTTAAIEACVPGHDYISYLTHERIPTDIDFVITPGESQLIPKGLPQVIDIGARVISMKTLQEITSMLKLGIKQETLTQLYIKSMIILADEKIVPKTVSFDDKNLHRTFAELNTNSPQLQSTIQIAKKLASTNHTVHIEGEVGTGKRMFAEMIHNHSPLASYPIYVYNCSDKELEMIQKELFSEDTGLIHSIPAGTIMIRNIDSLPYSLQGDLLKVIENSFRRNIRLITSSAKSFEDLLEKGAIRTEIYMYLSSYTMGLMNLAERKEDIDELIHDFKLKLNRVDMHFSDEVMEAFQQYTWPGNIRELFNVVSYCVCLNTNVIELDSLPIFFKGKQEQPIEVLDADSIIEKIEEHGFLNESIEILTVFNEGKEKNQSYGRSAMKTLLVEKELMLTDQQLRLRIDILRTLGLINVRRGRAGTTITKKGEDFLRSMVNEGLAN